MTGLCSNGSHVIGVTQSVYKKNSLDNVKKKKLDYCYRLLLYCHFGLHLWNMTIISLFFVFFVALLFMKSPVMNWRLVQGVPCLSPSVCSDSLQLPATLNKKSGHWWMDIQNLYIGSPREVLLFLLQEQRPSWGLSEKTAFHLSNTNTSCAASSVPCSDLLNNCIFSYFFQAICMSFHVVIKPLTGCNSCYAQSLINSNVTCFTACKHGLVIWWSHK